MNNRKSCFVGNIRQRSQIRPVITHNVSLQFDVEVDENNESCHRPCESPERRAGGCVVQPPWHEKTREDNHGHHAENLLYNLRHCRRRHTLPSLQIPAGTGEQGHEKDRRSKHHHSLVGTRITNQLPLDQPVCRQIGQNRKEQSCQHHEHHRDAKHTLRSVDILECDALRRNNRNRYRNTGLRDRHGKKINGERHLVETNTFAA